MSTLVCCELAGGRGPREGLRLALNRSLSEPGPPDLPSSAAAAAAAAADLKACHQCRWTHQSSEEVSSGCSV